MTIYLRNPSSPMHDEYSTKTSKKADDAMTVVTSRRIYRVHVISISIAQRFLSLGPVFKCSSNLFVSHVVRLFLCCDKIKFAGTDKQTILVAYLRGTGTKQHLSKNVITSKLTKSFVPPKQLKYECYTSPGLPTWSNPCLELLLRLKW